MQKKYEVLGVVGEGAYGIVYKCKNKETGKFVAIKKFKETDDELVQKTMKRELHMLQMLKHENCVDFQEAFTHKGNLFLVFEYVDKNLLEVLEESPNGLDPILIRSFVYQMCKAIAYLHENNMIHRDVKPENLLIDQDMKLKLCDFGFARKICLDKNNNNVDAMTDYVATRWYRAPELLLSNGIYGPEVDYWAVGCIMGELADGNPLFPGENEVDQLDCIIKVLGNLPKEQVNMFYENPIYNEKELLEVSKPETLQRRYMEKLSPTAIDFMKGLLELDPAKRLNGETVFKHRYFACFNKDKKEKEREKKEARTSETIINTRSNIVSTGNNKNSTSNSVSKKSIENSKVIHNTTNINIINYNNFNNSCNNQTSQNIQEPGGVQNNSINNSLKVEEKEMFYNKQKFSLVNKQKGNINLSSSSINNNVIQNNFKSVASNNEIKPANSNKDTIDRNINNNSGGNTKSNNNNNLIKVQCNNNDTSSKKSCSVNKIQSNSNTNQISKIGNKTMCNYFPNISNFASLSFSQGKAKLNGVKQINNISVINKKNMVGNANKNITSMNFIQKSNNSVNIDNSNTIEKNDHITNNNNFVSMIASNQMNGFKTFYNNINFNNNKYNYKINTNFKDSNINNPKNNTIDENEEYPEANVNKEGSNINNKFKKIFNNYQDANNYNNYKPVQTYRKNIGYGTFYKYNMGNVNFNVHKPKKFTCQLPQLYKLYAGGANFAHKNNNNNNKNNYLNKYKYY